MKVQDVISKSVQCCQPETSLSEAAVLMWDCDCGALPIVSNSDWVIGMVTDRDIAIGSATKGRPPSDITVREIMSGNVYACTMDEDVKSALKTMRREKVRRLPVVSPEGKLAGILSLNDIVLRAEEAKGKYVPEISYDDVVSTFKAICEHQKTYQASIV